MMLLSIKGVVGKYNFKVYKAFMRLEPCSIEEVAAYMEEPETSIQDSVKFLKDMSLLTRIGARTYQPAGEAPKLRYIYATRQNTGD